MLSSRKTKNILLLMLIVIYIVVYKFFIYTNLLKYAESITASFTLVLLALSIYLLGYRKSLNSNINTKSLKCIGWFLAFYFLLIYGLGLSTGYLSNSYSLKPITILENIFNLTIIIVATELFRYTFISANKDKKIFIFLMTVLLIVLETIMFIKFDTFKNAENIFRFVSLTILPLTMKNIMCSYITYVTNYKGALLYSLITELYVYIVPFEPDLGEWAKSIFELLLPFIILLDFSRTLYNYNQSAEHNFSKRAIKKSDIPFVIGTIVLMLLVFGIGPYKMIGIKTGSMTPAINAGDAVVIDKKCDKEKLKEEDIIAYENDSGVIVVHRIIKVNSDGTFITKGDYNNVADTIYVNKDQIRGKVKFRIPFIAYPSKWLS